MEIFFTLSLKLLYVYFLYLNFEEDAIANLLINFVNYPEEKHYLDDIYRMKKFVENILLSKNADFNIDHVIEICTVHVFRPIKQCK